MKAAGLIPAAGSGERLGLGPKALVRVGRRSLLQLAAAGLAHVVDEIVVAAPAALMGEFSAELPGARVIAGGATRQETVRRLLAATHADHVLIHDAARPFLDRAVAIRVLAAARASGAASAVTAVADTLVVAATGAAIDREPLRAVQTPQGFSRDLILQAHEHAARAGYEVTDDAGVARLAGHRVELVNGSSWLFKVTTADDLEKARLLATAWEQAHHDE